MMVDCIRRRPRPAVHVVVGPTRGGPRRAAGNKPAIVAIEPVHRSNAGNQLRFAAGLRNWRTTGHGSSVVAYTNAAGCASRRPDLRTHWGAPFIASPVW